MKTTPLSTTADWSFELIEKYEQAISKIAEEYGLDTYPTQIEIIGAMQMMDVYSAVGMPLGYYHWSFGKQFLTVEKNYRRGYMGLAYEIVINSNPCIVYLLEENTMAMQALVIAHACFGHNSFFKNNYLFKTWTNPEAIIDYLVFAKNYISQCEEKYGIDEVEAVLDACHALMNYGVDRYRHPTTLSVQKELERQKEREDYLQSQVNVIWQTIPKPSENESDEEEPRFPAEPQENLLYFIEKHAPNLESWQREIVRIVRKIAQYFYPQRQTKIMNEGWATFWHYTIINDLYDRGLVDDRFMFEFFQIHTDVILQPGFDHPFYNGINPYALGFSMWRDIRRICENPTEEDKKWFPEVAGSDWKITLDFAMKNFKDESFISQYLSPKLIRDLKLFSILNDDKNKDLVVSAIHDDKGYEHIRTMLAERYNISLYEPNIQIYNVDIKGDRSILLRHMAHNLKPLSSDTPLIMHYIHRLWGFPVKLESVDSDGTILATYNFPEEERRNTE